MSLSWIEITPSFVQCELEAETDIEVIEALCNLLGKKTILDFLEYQKRRYRIHTYMAFSSQLDPDEVAYEYP